MGVVTGAAQLRLRVAVAVRAAMGERELALRDVATEVGVAHSTVHRLLDGQGVDLEVLVALARWAGHDLAVLPRPAVRSASSLRTCGLPYLQDEAT